MGNSQIQNFNSLYAYMDTTKNKNANIIGYVFSINKSELEGYYKLKISIGNQTNNQFIIEPNLIESEFKNIKDIIRTKIEIKQIEFVSEGKNIYIKILNLIFSKNDKVNQEPKDEFHFNSTYIKSLKDLKSKQVELFSIVLKYNENNVFEDIDGQKIELKFSGYLIKESYYFIYNLYYKENEIRTLPITNICDYNDKKILKIMNHDSIISGEITNVYFYENKIDVRLKNNKKIKLLLNNKLMKKISPNLLCYFINFDKISNDYYKYNVYSSIFYDDNSILRIEFLDYKKNMPNKYDIIEVDSKEYSINGNIVDIPILSKYKKNSFIERIIYKNNNNRNRVEFFLELYKGKMNDYSSYLNLIKDGYSYEYQYESKYNSLLPEFQKIKLEKSEAIIKRKVTFGNKYRVKFGIINIPNQDFNNIEQSSNKYEAKSEKILTLLNKNDVKKTFYFKLEQNIEEKKDFEIDKTFEQKLSDFYNKYKDDYNKFYYNRNQIIKDYPELFHDEESSFESNNISNFDIIDKLNKNDEFESLISKENNNDINLMIERSDKIIKKEVEINNNEINYRKYCELGFKKFNFKNTKEEYEKIKKLCFLYILKYFNYKINNMEFNSVLFNFFFLMKKMTNLEYIDKIHILLGFINDKIFDEDKRETPCQYYLINLDDNNIDDSFKYSVKAYDLFFRIINELKEDSAFFICLTRINSSIFYEKTTKNKMYSGTMLTINDIKLEIYKKVKRYFFITQYNNDCYAHFSPYTKMVFYHPLTFLNDKLLSISKDKIENATVAILFLIFHEVCGHFKTLITNLDGTLDKFYNDKYNILKYELRESNDSGNIFEYFLCSDFINISGLFEKVNVKQLLSVDLYIDKTFSKLNSILESMDVLKRKNNHKFKSNLKAKKILFSDMTKILFRLRIGCKNAEEFKKLINDNPEYKLMLEKVKMTYKRIHYKP